MLVKPELEKLLPKVDNRYTLAIVVAKRARQLVDGAQPLAKSSSPNLVTIACEELAADRIVCLRGQVKPYIPLKPEIEAARLAAKAAEEQADMADKVKDALDQAVGIESEQKPEPDDIQIITENLITLSEDITASSLDVSDNEQLSNIDDTVKQASEDLNAEDSDGTALHLESDTADTDEDAADEAETAETDEDITDEAGTAEIDEEITDEADTVKDEESQ